MTEIRNRFGSVVSRRGFLHDANHALAAVGLVSLLYAERTAAGDKLGPVGRRTARAQRVLQIFCPGGASHMDLWEHKPELERRDGQPLPGGEDFLSFQGKNGNLMKSPWPLVPCGESGKRISSLLPHMAGHVDDIAFIHSMTSESNTHGPGCVFMNTGHATEGFPAAGAWLSYALGSGN